MTGVASQCTMCTLDSLFSFRPSALGHIVQPEDCHIIEHIIVPTRSDERTIEKIRFPWVSNSKFVNFPQIFPCSNYKMCPIIPLLFPDSNGDSPVATIFPCSNYRGILTTGESYCTMYTLCNVRQITLVPWLIVSLCASFWHWTQPKNPSQVREVLIDKWNFSSLCLGVAALWLPLDRHLQVTRHRTQMLHPTPINIQKFLFRSWQRMHSLSIHKTSFFDFLSWII